MHLVENTTFTISERFVYVSVIRGAYADIFIDREAREIM